MPSKTKKNTTLNEPVLGSEKNAPLRRKYNRTCLRRFSRLELKNAINHFVKEDYIMPRTDLGPLNKMNIDKLIVYPPAYAVANIRKMILERRAEHDKRMAKFAKTKKDEFDTLHLFVTETLVKAIVHFKLDTNTDVHSLNKPYLMEIILQSPDLKKILKFCREYQPEEKKESEHEHE